MACKHCGRCCLKCAIQISSDESLIRFLHYHSVEVLRGSDGNTAIVVNQPCRYYLPRNEKHCAIYEDRPTLCRDFICPDAQETGRS